MIPTLASKKLGEEIKKLRIERGMTEAELAEGIEESPYFIRLVERGLIDPMMKDVFKIIRTLNTTIPEFFSSFDE